MLLPFCIEYLFGIHGMNSYQKCFVDYMTGYQ